MKLDVVVRFASRIYVDANIGAFRYVPTSEFVGGEVVEGEAHAFPYRFQKEAMMRSTGSMSAMVSWGKMALCVDRPGIAPQRLAGTWGSRWGPMRRRRMVQTILTSLTAHTMGRQLSGLVQSPFL